MIRSLENELRKAIIQLCPLGMSSLKMHAYSFAKPIAGYISALILGMFILYDPCLCFSGDI